MVLKHIHKIVVASLVTGLFIGCGGGSGGSSVALLNGDSGV
jgi:hypothetical protein